MPLRHISFSAKASIERKPSAIVDIVGARPRPADNGRAKRRLFTNKEEIMEGFNRRAALKAGLALGAAPLVAHPILT